LLRSSVTPFCDVTTAAIPTPTHREGGASCRI
jgi:hypothetical protein